MRVLSGRETGRYRRWQIMYFPQSKADSTQWFSDRSCYRAPSERCSTHWSYSQTRDCIMWLARSACGRRHLCILFPCFFHTVRLPTVSPAHVRQEVPSLPPLPFFHHTFKSARHHVQDIRLHTLTTSRNKASKTTEGRGGRMRMCVAPCPGLLARSPQGA